MIKDCNTCGREERIHVRGMCLNCYNSKKQKVRARKGLISEETREKKKKIFREWYENNKDKHKQHMKKYAANNKHKLDVRRADGFKREEILNKFNNECVDCQSNNNLELHHKDYEDNKEVIVLCRACHGKRHRLCAK